MALRTHFRVVNAGDLCNSLHAHMKSIVNSSKADLEAYQAPSFSKFLHKVKNFFMGSTITKDNDSVAKLVIDFSHPWLKSTCKRDKHASGGPGRPVSVDS